MTLAAPESGPSGVTRSAFKNPTRATHAPALGQQRAPPSLDKCQGPETAHATPPSGLSLRRQQRRAFGGGALTGVTQIRGHDPSYIDMFTFVLTQNKRAVERLDFSTRSCPPRRNKARLSPGLILTPTLILITIPTTERRTHRGQMASDRKMCSLFHFSCL